MKITPRKSARRLSRKHCAATTKDEGIRILQTLSQEWERTVDETKEMRIKLEGTEREVNKLREVESSLFKTLKTAEDTGGKYH